MKIRHRNRYLSWLLLVSMFCAMLLSPVQAQDSEMLTYIDGKGVQWNYLRGEDTALETIIDSQQAIQNAAVLMISGQVQGQQVDSVRSNGFDNVVVGHKDSQYILVASGITSISAKAFYDFNYVKGVSLPASLIGRPEKLHIQPVQVANDSCVEFKAHLDKILAIQPVDEDSARDLVFKLAAARYDQIGSAEYETERLKRIFAAAEPMETLDAELLKSTVAAIHIQGNGAICLELKNHQMIAR